jgi:hypothetical protein
MLYTKWNWDDAMAVLKEETREETREESYKEIARNVLNNHRAGFGDNTKAEQ